MKRLLFVVSCMMLVGCGGADCCPVGDDPVKHICYTGEVPLDTPECKDAVCHSATQEK